MAVQLPKHRFTVEDYHQMGEAGILDGNSRVELIEGEIVDMTPIGPHHASAVGRINALLISLFGGKAIVYPQNPLFIPPDSEPVPDFAILKFQSDFYARQLPTAQDVLLLIEVSDSTIATDRATKAPLYARAGVPELWLVNIGQDLVEVYSQPENGAYGQVELARRGQTLPLPGFTELTLQVDDLLG